ncbi:MAG: hypothetical protein WBE26_19830 [Phycisphaerae bacterium]
MNAYDFVHLAFLAVGGEIRGKTRLQKTIYFLGVLTKSVDELGFHAHYYGPYSEEVADAMGRLTVLGFVDQNVVGGGAVNEFGFEVARYDYRLNEDGRAIAEWKAKQHPDEMQKLRDAAEKLKWAGDLDYMKLSVAAKTYFMLETKERATMAELTKQARRFGWRVSEDEVRKAGEYLSQLGLVELVEAD